MQRYIRSGSEQRSKPQFFTVEEVHTLYRSADPTMRACIALALNTGYTQIDIASLTRDHIGEGGIVNRERSKTGQPQCHKLWPVTLDALETANRLNPRGTSVASNEPMLRTNTGLLLVEEKWKNGEPFRSDRLGVLFGNHAREQGITGRSFKHWRKTAGNLIEQHEPGLTSLFLSHSETGMKKHYVNPHFDKLHELTDSLESHWGLANID